MTLRLYKPKAKESIAAAYSTGTDTNDAVVITLPASANGVWVVHGLSWSYSGDPTNGQMSVAGGGINYSWDITVGGPGFIPLPPGGGGEEGDMATDIVVTLAAGGEGIVGRLNVHAELLN